MGAFVLGAVVALFIGMQLARHIDGSRGARGEYTTAKGGLPGLRKKAFSLTFGFIRFVVVLGLIVVAAVYGWIRHNT